MRYLHEGRQALGHTDAGDSEGEEGGDPDGRGEMHDDVYVKILVLLYARANFQSIDSTWALIF